MMGRYCREGERESDHNTEANDEAEMGGRDVGCRLSFGVLRLDRRFVGSLSWAITNILRFWSKSA